MTGSGVRVALFDVQGTLTDWWTTLTARAGSVLGGRVSAPSVQEVLLRWRRAYGQELAGLLAQRRWRPVAEVYRDTLTAVVAQCGLPALSEPDAATLTAAWRELRPWPDAAEGLARLRRGLVVAALSNAETSSVVQVSRAGGLHFDAVLSAQMIGSFKPDPSTYLSACRWLGADPAETVMVASHPYDLDGAAAVGLLTAFIHRPGEHGPHGPTVDVDPSRYDYAVASVEELAGRLGL